MSQLGLPLTLSDYAVFESFYPGPNESIVAYLANLVNTGKGPGCWVWGGPATGKTHLLQAVCERAGDASLYLPLADLAASSPEILDGLAERKFVCLDDLQVIAGDADWELALFDSLNELTDSGGVLTIAATAAPRECGLKLPDLLSRLTRLPVFNLKALDDGERIQALQLRAEHRGLELPEKTASYILDRSRRDMSTLYSQLDRLDTESLQARRKLTIPFVRDVLGL